MRISEIIKKNEKMIEVLPEWQFRSELITENIELKRKLGKEKQRKKEIFQKIYNKERKVKTEKVIALNYKKGKNFYALPYFLASEVTEADLEREEQKAAEYEKFQREKF